MHVVWLHVAVRTINVDIKNVFALYMYDLHSLNVCVISDFLHQFKVHHSCT